MSRTDLISILITSDNTSNMMTNVGSMDERLGSAAQKIIDYMIGQLMTTDVQSEGFYKNILLFSQK